MHATSWHPTRPGVLFASAGAVYRSTDNGLHWSAVSNGGLAGENYVFDPHDPDRILVSGSLLRSTDGGATFSVASTTIPAFTAYRLAITADGSAVYAASGSKAYRSLDFGSTWEERSNGIPDTGEPIVAVRTISTDSQTAYVLMAQAGLFRTTNGGLNWSAVSTPGTSAWDLVVNPANPADLLLSTQIPANLWRSTDAGATWSIVAPGFFYWHAYDPAVPARVLGFEEYTHRIVVSTDSGNTWTSRAPVPAFISRGGAASTTSGGGLAVATSAGVYFSADAGQSLEPRNAGIRASTARELVSSASAPWHIYASFYGGPEGLHRGAASTWTASDPLSLFAAVGGVPTPIYTLTVDANDPDTLYAGTFRGLLRTADGGASWVALPAVPQHIASSLAIDPADSRIIYSASSQGILRSPDGGNHFEPRNNGLPVPQPGNSFNIQYLAIHPTNHNTLYALLNGNEAYRSNDAGLNWTRMPLGANAVLYSMAFDPADANRLYLATNQGLSRSLDGGASWSPVVLPLGSDYVAAVLVNPLAPSTLTVATGPAPYGILRSVDQGATWERLAWPSQDQRFAPSKAVFDLSQSGNLVVATSAAGLLEFRVAPDLSLTLTGLTGVASPGTPQTLHVVAQNKAANSYAASDVTLTVNLPVVAMASAATTNRGTCSRAGQILTCRLGALKTGESASVDIPLAFTSGSGDIVASLQAREHESAPADNTVTTAITVQPTANVGVQLALPVSVNRGAALSVQAQLSNAGPDAAANTRLVFTLPSGLTASSASASAGTCVISGTAVTCQLGSLPASGSSSVTVQAIASSTGGQSVQVVASSDAYDPAPPNNTASASTTVKPVVDLGISLGNTPSSMQESQTTNVAATVTNTGPDAALIAVATLSGNNLRILSATPGSGSCAVNDGSASCSLGLLSAGASTTIDVSYSVSTPGSARLDAVTASEGSDANSANNEAQRSITVTATPSGGGGNAGGGGSSGSGSGNGSSGGGSVQLWGLLLLASWVLGSRIAPRWFRRYPVSDKNFGLIAGNTGLMP